jgi:hypothetical protein
MDMVTMLGAAAAYGLVAYSGTYIELQGPPTDGKSPIGTLLQVPNGTLYGIRYSLCRFIRLASA